MASHMTSSAQAESIAEKAIAVLNSKMVEHHRFARTVLRQARRTATRVATSPSLWNATRP